MMPTRKVYTGAVAGAAMIIVAWAAKAFGKIELPAEVAMAGTTIITAFVQYFVPDHAAPPAAPSAEGGT